MEGAASANGEAAPGVANKGGDAAEAPDNQQRDEELGAANKNASLKGSSNEKKRSCGSTNEDIAPQELNHDSKEPRPTNQDTGHKPPTNKDTGHKSPTNENAATPAANKNPAPPSPTDQDTARGAAANENNPRQAPPNQDTAPTDPSSELAALPAVANQARDPWDWSLEEAWLRAPEGEGLEAWGAEPEGGWVEPDEDEDEDDDAEDDEDPERWRPSPDGAWLKLVVRRGRGVARPGPGSRCRVLLSVPSSSSPGSAPPSPLSLAGRWASVSLGTAEGRWSCLVDSVLETMSCGERARLRPAGLPGLSLTVRLGRFSPAPAFWDTAPSARWRSVTSGHARASALLSRGLLSAAGRAFSRALRAAVAAGGAGPVPAELAALKAELHAGLALVQLRLGLPAAAASNAGKALELRPAHLEARFQRGLALAAMRDLEAAMADLGAVLREQPGHAGARRELRRVRGAARERDARLARRLGRLFA